MADGMTAAEAAALYEREFHAWTTRQAAVLRALAEGRNPQDAPDLLNLAGEIESLGKRDKRELESLVAQIAQHLGRLEAFPHSDAAPHWRAEVREFRRQAQRVLRDSPSLRRGPEELVKDESADAIARLARELDEGGGTTETVHAILARAGGRYALGEILDDWWPGPA